MGSAQKINSDILVSGGGIAGLTFAMLMANLGLSVHVIDPASPKNWTPPRHPAAPLP